MLLQTGGECMATSRPKYITGASGVIKSTNNNGNYPNNADCQWLLKSSIPNGVSIVLNDLRITCNSVTVY